MTHAAECSREPKRVCEMCSSILAPVQPVLVETHSRASQEPVHDVMDSTAIRSWLNNPLTRSLEQDIYKATNILRDVQRVSVNKDAEAFKMVLRCW